MNGGAELSPNGVMSVQEQREEVQRVLHSAQFRRAPKLQRFLSLICAYYFDHRTHEINEYVIAIEAFGKAPDFDASQDSLVRVQAREARRRLHEYYQDEGKDSKLILGIPLGSYAPVFSTPAGPSPPKRVPMLRTAWAMLASTAVVCAVLLFSAERERRLWMGASNIASAQASASAMTPLVSRLWSRFLESESPTVLVLSNPDVGECTDTGPADPKGPSAAAVKETPCPDEYTGMGEAVAISLFTNLFRARKKDLIVKQSRMVNEDDVKRYNLILLGGKKSVRGRGAPRRERLKTRSRRRGCDDGAAGCGIDPEIRNRFRQQNRPTDQRPRVDRLAAPSYNRALALVPIWETHPRHSCRCRRLDPGTLSRSVTMAAIGAARTG